MATTEGHAVYERAVRELEAARARVRDLEGFVRIYAELVDSAFSLPAPGPEEPHPVPVPIHRPPAHRPEVSLADPSLSISEAAVKVLRYHVQPMKARQIAQTMLAWGFKYDGTVQDLRASVGGVLAREVRVGGDFTKVRTGTFGLKEWLTDTGRIEEEDEYAADDDAEGQDEDGAYESDLEHSGSLFEEVVAASQPTEEAMR